MRDKLNYFDKKITNWLRKYGYHFLRFSLSLIFIWFGILKPIGLSSAQELVTNTVYWFNPSWFVPLLGFWEILIGICLIIKPLVRLGLLLMAILMVGTFLPLILLPDIVYVKFPYALTLEGQYIIKNLILIGAGMVIGSHVRD